MCDEKSSRFGEGVCSQGLVAEEPTGAREELVTDRASCRAAATSRNVVKYSYEAFCLILFLLNYA